MDLSLLSGNCVDRLAQVSWERRHWPPVKATQCQTQGSKINSKADLFSLDYTTFSLNFQVWFNSIEILLLAVGITFISFISEEIPLY